MIVYRELKKSSLMPVRDAMRRLVAERALEMRPLRTSAIPVLSADQFLAIRLLLEGEAVTRAAAAPGCRSRRANCRRWWG